VGRIKTIEHNIGGICVNQKENDGYVNATDLCKAHRIATGERKDPNDWLRLKSSQSAMKKLSDVTGIPVTSLFNTVQGKGKYQGTWIHPRLAVRFAMWVNDDFSLQVEDWVHDWLSSGSNPVRLEADIDRVALRDELKDSRRLALTEQVKLFLETAGQYNPSSPQTQIFFGRVHNEVNLALTGEKAIDMRLRLETHVGKKVSEKELLRDYFPITDLANYAAVCQAAANNMENGGMHPINAIRLAARQVLPSSHIPKQIDFVERIKIVRLRIEQARNQGLLPE
jgi:hypothetical protein